MSNDIMSQNKSSISINDFANKLYIDPKYGMYQPRATLNYSVFRGKWEIEDSKEDNSVRLINVESGDSLFLSFNSLKDKIEFVKGIYTEYPIKQVGSGMNLENLANDNVKPKFGSYVDNLLKRIVSNIKTTAYSN